MDVFDNLKQQYNLMFNITKDRLVYHSEISKEFIGMCLYLTIFENCGACINLIENQFGSSIEVLIRNLLEANIDLMNLREDTIYLKFLQVNDLKQEIALLKNCKKNPNNEYIRSVYEKYKNIDDEIAKLEKEKKDIIEQLDAKYGKIIKNQKYFTIISKFKIGNQEDIYDSIYNLLCRYSHNNLSSLMGRHLYLDCKIQSFKRIEQSDYNLYCEVISVIIMESLENIYKILNIEEDEELKEVKRLRERFVKIFE